MNLDYASLKARHRAVREAPGYSQALSLRAHRALSWLQRAEREQDCLQCGVRTGDRGPQRPS
jgi:hypothetical protein